jgi:lambda repressor-like predicted transcriptional regulator
MLKGYNREFPNGTHELVKILFNEIDRQGITYKALSEKAGVSTGSLKSWQNRVQPELILLEACLNALGLKITVERFK